MGLHQVWKTVMHLECGDSCRFALYNCYTSSRHLQRKNLPVCKLSQWHPCGANQTSTRSCLIQQVCMKVSTKSMGINAPWHYVPYSSWAPQVKYIFRLYFHLFNFNFSIIGLRCVRLFLCDFYLLAVWFVSKFKDIDRGEKNK